MSLEEALPTLDDLRSINVDEILAAAEHPACWEYANAFLDFETMPAKGSGGWKARTLLGFVTSLRLDLDAEAGPFSIGSWFGKLGPTALSKAQLDALDQWLGEVTDPELRARIADLLWMTRTPRNHLHGRGAVEAYADAAERHFGPNNHWPHGVEAFERAMMLARPFKMSDAVVVRIESVLDGRYGPAEGPRDAGLMRILLTHRAGDPAKYARLAEAEAERLEAKAATESYATNLSLMLAREYWNALAQWRMRELGPAAPEVQRARLRYAETYVKEADKGRDANEPLVEAHFLSNAITELRRAGADRVRVEGLLARMMAANRDAPRAFVNTSVNVTQQVFEGRRAVEGRTFRDSIRCLVSVTDIPTIADLRTMATDFLSKSITSKLFPVALTSSDYRIVAHMPPLSNDDERSDDNEAVIRWHMWKQAEMLRVFSVARIESAREQLVLEHNPRIQDLMPFVTASALVPPGHEGLFARGLHAGFHGDFAVAIHILLPQLENGLRGFIENVLGKPMVSHDDDGTQSVNLFKRVLSHPDLASVLGEDLLFTLRGLLIVQEATNLRNHLSHGLLSDHDIGMDAIYAWWICLLLCVGLQPTRATPAVDAATAGATPAAGDGAQSATVNPTGEME